jgi:hypothetical protein
MENFDDNEIGKLLRVKRYEQPPPGYFENFLHEFHRRQRDELLRQPIRFALSPQHSVAHFYASRGCGGFDLCRCDYL